MKIVLKYLSQIAVVAILVAYIQSCNVKKHAVNKSDIDSKIPSAFIQQKDTSSVNFALDSYQLFFKDTTLVSLIDLTLKNNLDLQIYNQRIEKANAEYFYSKGTYLPSLQAEVKAAADQYGKYTMNGVGNYDTDLSQNVTGDMKIPTSPTPDYFVGLRSNWELDILGKLRRQKKSAYYRMLATEQGKNFFKTQLIGTVSILYYHQLALQEELSIVRKNIGLQDTVVNIIKIQKEGGRATELAVQQAQSLSLSTKTLEVEIQAYMAQNQNNLQQITGQFQLPFNYKTEINPKLDTVRKGIPVNLLFNRPDIKQAELELMSANMDVEAARLAFFPSLQLDLYTGFNAFKTSVLFTTPASLVWGAVGGLAAPIFQKRKLKASLKYSEAHQKEAFLNYHKTILAAYQEVSTELSNIDKYNKMIALKKKEVDILHSAVKTSNDLFVVGYANYLEVITAQKNVLNAEINLIELIQKQLNAYTNLYRTLGGGWR